MLSARWRWLTLACLACLACILLTTVPCDAQNPPTDVWCEYQQLPLDLPFVEYQPIWWMEYFMFNATKNQTLGFKVYPGLESDAYLQLIVGTNYCPVFNDSANNPNAYAHGTAEIVMEVMEGNSYVLFAHMSGSNYTIMGCEGPCPMACPNDCTNFQGICDVANGSCNCLPGWVSDNCSVVYVSPNSTAPQPKRKIPFGNEAVFLTVVAGVPTALVITAITVGIIYKLYRDKEKQLQKQKETRPLIIPTPVYGGGIGGGGGENGSYRRPPSYGTNRSGSVSMSPSFPLHPQHPPPPTPDALDDDVADDARNGESSGVISQHDSAAAAAAAAAASSHRSSTPTNEELKPRKSNKYSE